jgi:hypothetical protein
MSVVEKEGLYVLRFVMLFFENNSLFLQIDRNYFKKMIPPEKTFNEIKIF